ncbi:MAG: hypothetical protein NTV02_02300 [Candidatus Zambryskibacteria bacterium]|nr:hypothetical protein [Candidatus Zambryskibacteria bacterium]
MRKKIIIGSIALLLAILVGYFASTAFTTSSAQKKEVVTSKTTPVQPTNSTEPTKQSQDMTTMELIFRIVLYLGILVVGILVWEKYGLGEYWKTYWVNNPFMQTIVYAGMVNLIIYKFFPDFWWENMCSWWAVLFYSMAALSLSVKNKIGKIVGILILIAFIIHIGGWDVEAKAKGLLNSTTTTTKPIVTIEKKPCIEDDPQHGPDKEKAIKALKDYPVLFALACRESRFNQMDPKNPTKVLRGKENPDDTGIMQINRHIHKDLIKEKGVDIDTFEGNIAFAKFLYDDKGIDHWFPIVSGQVYKPITIVVVAHKDVWSPVIKIPALTRGARFDKIKKVKVRIDGKREVIFDPKVDNHWGSVKLMEFQSIDGDKTVVRITMEFWPVP